MSERLGIETWGKISSKTVLVHSTAYEWAIKQ